MSDTPRLNRYETLPASAGPLRCRELARIRHRDVRSFPVPSKPGGGKTPNSPPPEGGATLVRRLRIAPRFARAQSFSGPQSSGRLLCARVES